MAAKRKGPRDGGWKGDLFIGDEVCPKTEGEHMPDWSAVTPADGAPGIVDVPCCNCGRSGSVAINPGDVQW